MRARPTDDGRPIPAVPEGIASNEAGVGVRATRITSPLRIDGILDGVRFGDVGLFAAKSNAAPEPSATRAIQNIAIEFANVDEALKSLQGRGVKTISEPRVAQPVRYAFVEDPNRVRVELITTLRP